MTEFYNTTEVWLVKNWISVSDMAPYNIFLGLLTFGCTLLGTPGNILAGMYFWSHAHKRVSTHLYGLLCLANSSICAMSLAVALSGMTNNSSILFKYQIFCTIWGVAWSTLDRMIVCILVVFSCTRIITLHFPFFNISNRSALIPVAVYFILSLVQGLLPLISGTDYKHIPYHTSSCLYDMVEIFPYGSVGYSTMVGFIVLVQFDLLICLMIIMIGKATWMLRDTIRNRATPRRHSREAACVTMIMITGTYVVLNLPYCILYTLHFVEIVAGIRIMKLSLRNKTADILTKVVYELTTLHVIAITSTVEMVVLYSRNSHLRNYVFATLCFWKFSSQNEQRQTFSSRITSDTQFNSRNVTIEMVDMKRWKSAIFRPALPDPTKTIPASKSAPNLQLECLVNMNRPDMNRPRSNSDDVGLRSAEMDVVNMSTSSPTSRKL